MDSIRFRPNVLLPKAQKEQTGLYLCGMNAYLRVRVALAGDLREPCIALLSEIGFDSFEETPSGVDAYLPKELFDDAALRETLEILGDPAFEVSELEDKNWNALWESTIGNIAIDDFCQLVPHFRQPEPGFVHTLTITPKMSFGTGHHETTRLMVRNMRNTEMAGQTVLDMGCGTGVLGILAARMGAKAVTYIDIDPWSVDNTEENIAANDVQAGATVLLGDVAVLSGTFDGILANINRNILTRDGAQYVAHLAAGGWLMVSGFYDRDVPEVQAYFEGLGCQLSGRQEENHWVSLAFRKN